jgi:hypothetical protein
VIVSLTVEAVTITTFPVGIVYVPPENTEVKPAIAVVYAPSVTQPTVVPAKTIVVAGFVIVVCVSVIVPALNVELKPLSM